MPGSHDSRAAHFGHLDALPPEHAKDGCLNRRLQARTALSRQEGGWSGPGPHQRQIPFRSRLSAVWQGLGLCAVKMGTSWPASGRTASGHIGGKHPMATHELHLPAHLTAPYEYYYYS